MGLSDLQSLENLFKGELYDGLTDVEQSSCGRGEAMEQGENRMNDEEERMKMENGYGRQRDKLE